MNKQDLIAKIVKDTGATKATAGKMLDSTVDIIGKALKKGDTFGIRGLRHVQDLGPQGPGGPQPAHRRSHQDREAPRAPLHRRQVPQGPRQVDPAVEAGMSSGSRPGGRALRRARPGFLDQARRALTPARARCYTEVVRYVLSGRDLGA